MDKVRAAMICAILGFVAIIFIVYPPQRGRDGKLIQYTNPTPATVPMGLAPVGK